MDSGGERDVEIKMQETEEGGIRGLVLEEVEHIAEGEGEEEEVGGNQMSVGEFEEKYCTRRGPWRRKA